MILFSSFVLTLSAEGLLKDVIIEGNLNEEDRADLNSILNLYRDQSLNDELISNAENEINSRLSLSSLYVSSVDQNEDGDYIVTINADSSSLPTTISSFVFTGDELTEGERLLVNGELERYIGRDINDVMTGMRALSPLFAKAYPVMSPGFELETELTIFALENRFRIHSCPVPYRDRPEGSTSKLSTYRDGFKVLKTIFRMYRDYRPFKVFGIAACFLALLSLVLFVPVFGEYLVTGLVPRLPTLIVSGLSMSMAMLSFCAGLIMERIYLGQRQNLEILLNMLHMELKQHTSTAATDSLESV